MYTCEICELPVDEIDDIGYIPNPSILDPDAVVLMCRTCAQATIVDYEDYFGDDDEDLDPIFIEEMFGLDALEDEDDGELY